MDRCAFDGSNSLSFCATGATRFQSCWNVNEEFDCKRASCSGCSCAIECKLNSLVMIVSIESRQCRALPICKSILWPRSQELRVVANYSSQNKEQGPAHDRCQR